MDFSKVSIFLNKKKLSAKATRKIFNSIQNEKIIKEKGGYIFKSSICKSNFHIGIVPSFIEGERTHHYDIELGYEDEYILTGFINIDRTIGFLFTPPGKKESINQDFRDGLKESYSKTAEILIQNGFPPDFRLDWITKKMLEDAKLFLQTPENLDQLKRF